MGETQHVFPTSSSELGIPSKDRSFKPFGKKDGGEFDGPFLGGTESLCPPPGREKGLGLKEKEPPSQREAVIRPQQAGKIDFKSLHSRAPFPSDSPWGAFKGSPQSPTGRSRARERSRRPGKGEQRPGHQQLYRLAISSARPGPTIGIAYPQQKVTPPKKAEVAQGGAASGSYRFHVPEREAELPQGDLAFARCFPEASSSLLSGHYTSSAVAPRLHPATKVPPHPGIPHEGPGPNGQLHYLDNGSHAWLPPPRPPPEKSLPGATSNGPSASRPAPFPESGKAGLHSPGPLSFHYQPPDPFSGEDHAGEYTDLSLAASPSSHGAFAFHGSSREWKEGLPLSACNGLALESRACGLPPAFPPGQTPGPLPGYKGRKEPPSDPNGAISPPGAMDSNSSTFQESRALFLAGLPVSSKQPPSLKDDAPGPRSLDPGSALRRTAPPAPLPHVHFQNKASAGPVASPSPVPLEKSLPSAAPAQARLSHPWEGSRRPPGPPAEGATAYLSPLGSQLSFGGPLGPEPWQPTRKPWQPLPLASALPGQSRIELLRKLPFPLASGNAPKSPLDCAGGRAPLTGEGAIMQRPDHAGPQPCSSATAFCFEGAKEAEPPRAKALFFGLSPAALATSSSSHLPSIPVLATSPSESPVLSPALHAPGGGGSRSSTCSSLSSTSSSPSALEDGPLLDAPAFVHHPCHPRSSHKPFLAPEALSHVADPLKALLLSPGPANQELLYKPLPAGGEGPLPKPCLGGLEAELPPPPYSSHHFLASSLSSASLDQLDVFLTCKQCDQNFSNLSSFLEHRQFCSSHLGLPSQAKEAPHRTESRRQPPDPGKHTPGGPGVLLPPEPHLQLMALSKAPDFLVDEDGKGGSRDDSLRANSLGGAATHPLPLLASDLDIDDAKLDSLITEALNGLGYQSDNPEIDSSFIDVFADEELASVKVAGGGGGGMPCKPKEGMSPGKKVTYGETEESENTASFCHDRPYREKARASGKQRGPRERGTGCFHGKASLETPGSPALPPSKGVDPEMYGGEPLDSGARPKGAQRDSGSPLLTRKQGAEVTHTTKRPKATSSLPTSKLRSPRRATAAKGNVKEAKKQMSRGGTWSKELIHKIVQQKNKLHKLQATGSKATAFSLLADRRVPERKDGQFGEYDYISESDDERVEEAKRHCRRKPGSRFSRRLRGGFGRRRPGRGGQEKEPEPTWRLGPRRGLGEEPRRKEERLARAWRRSGRSSTSSCPSTGFSSEGSHSSPSTERPDSDTEKESEPRKRRLVRERPAAPAKAPGGRSPAETPPEGFQAAQAQHPDVSAGPYASQEGAWLPAEEKPLANKGPGGFGGNHDHRDSCQAGAMTAREAGHRHPHHFPACPGAALKYPEEEELPLPGEGHAGYGQGLVARGLKKPTECMDPASCFNSSAADTGMAGKGPAAAAAAAAAAGLFSDCKGLPGHSDPSGLFSGAAPVEASPSASFYLCPRDLEEKPQPSVPYRAGQDQPAPSPPLGFDATSVFGELPAAVFDATLYEAMAPSRDDYVPFECPGHPLGRAAPFEQHYPSFLQEKAWALMEEGAALLPEDLPPFHSLPEEKARRDPQPRSPLPKRVPDYGVPFLSGLSEDELEIKRLVTELEHQLQAGKLPTMEETPGDHPAAPKPHEERTEPLREFLPLALDQERPGKGLFLTGPGFEAGDLLSTNGYSCESPDHEKSALAPKYGSPLDAWPCSAPFSPLEPTLRAPPASGLILASPLSARGDQGRLYQNLSAEASFRGLRDGPARMGADPCLPDMGYPQQRLHSPEPLLLATLEAAQLPAPRTPPAAPFLELPPEEKALDGAAGLGPYRPPRPCLGPVFGQGEVAAPEESESNLPSAIASPASPKEEEEAFPESRSPEVLASAEPPLPREIPETKENGSQAFPQSPAARGPAGDGAAVPLEPLDYSEEEPRREAGSRLALEEKAPNPLEQLQLFVARTAKHNEEELLLPCFPVGLSAPHLHGKAPGHPRQEKEPPGTMPGKEAANTPVSLAMEETEGATQGPDPTKWFLETDLQGKRPGEGVASCTAAEAELQSPERHDARAQGQPRGPSGEEDCSKGEERNAPPGGLSPEHSNTAATASPKEEAALAGQVTGESEEGQRKASLAFQSERKSPLSRGSLAQAKPGGASATLLKAPAPCQAAGLPPLEDLYLPRGTGAPLGTGPVWAEGRAVPPEEASPGSHPLKVRCAELDDPKEEDQGTGSVADSGVGLPPSEEPGCLAVAEGQQSPLFMRRLSPRAGKGAIGKATRSPSACKGEHRGLQLSPILQHAGAPSPLASEPTASPQERLAKEMGRDLAAPQKKAPTNRAISLCPSDLATCLLGTGQPMEPQRESCTSPRVPPLENPERSHLEECPKHLGDVNSGLCGARGAVTSPACRENIPLGQSPAEADPALLTKDRAAKSVEFSFKNLAGKKNKKCPRHPAQAEIPSRGVHRPVMSRANFGETGAAGGAQPNCSHFPEVAENGLEGALQDLPGGGPALEEKNSGWKEHRGGLPRCAEPEGNMGESLRDASKTRQPRKRRRKGVPSTCDVCFIPFKSKTGLMRHKAVKHLKKNVDSLIPDPDPAPPEVTLEPSKALSRRNRKPFATGEGAGRSLLPKAAAGRPCPKSYRGPKREPSREIQEVVSKVLSDLSVVSSAVPHKLKRRGGPSKETEARSESWWAGGAEELALSSPKEATPGGRGRKAGAKEPERFAGRKLKGKARKGKAEVAPGPWEASRHPPEGGIPSLPSKGALESLDLVATTGPEGRATSPTCPLEEQARGPPPPWPLGPVANKGAAGRSPATEETAGPRPVRDAESGPEPAAEGRPRAGQEVLEGGRLSSPCEEQDEVVAAEESQPKGSALQGRKGTDPDSPSALQAAHRLGRAPPDVASDKATEAACPFPAGAESWRTEEGPPKMEEPQGSSAVAPDLQSLFDSDSDSTFSQLFPRKDRFNARRKCTRVYRKRAKKPRPVAEAKTRPEGAPDPLTIRMASDLGDTGSLCITREDPCEYDTISLDDTLLLHMCRGGSAGGSEAGSGSAERMALQPEAAPSEEDWQGAVGFLGQKDPAGSPLSFRRQTSAERAAEEVSAGGASLGPRQELTAGRSAAETSPEGPDLEEGAFEPQTGKQVPSPAFHTLEMEMLMAKFEVRDLSLCEVGDGSLGQAGAFALPPTPALQSRPAKHKPEEGKPGKGRGEPAPKAKDKQYKCKVCFQWFLTLGELDFHKLSHNPSPPPTCYMCVQRKFSSREQLRDHLREKHAKNKAGLWACGMCLKEISDVWMYNEHLREHATQFARRGQAQTSVLGFSGCFGEDEAAVARFLNSIIRQRPSKASRQGELGGRPPAGKESQGPKEPPGPEGALGKEPLQVPARTKPPAASPKAPPSPGPAPKAEGPRKLAQAVHPECKDPSRDCHHCGKQFPKPFKLQRHLVVHSFQRVYLCPLCPMFYQETKELRCHLAQEHRAAEAAPAELKHTTLYACELCADVMHVIKKSFICSACNYTFSKKEQFDRHMEKHRLGSRRTFRFRGVMRPGASLGREGGKKAKEEEEAPRGGGLPAAKRKKASLRPGLLSAPTAPPACSDGAREAPLPPAAHRNPLLEGLGGGFSSPLAKRPTSSPGSPPPATPPLSPDGASKGGPALGPLRAGLRPEGNLRAEPLPPSLDPLGAGSGLDLASSASAAPKGPLGPPPEKHSKEPSGKAPVDNSMGPAVGPWASLYLEEGPVSTRLEFSSTGAEATERESQGSLGPPPDEMQPQDGAPERHLQEAALQGLPPCEAKAASPSPARPAKETPSKAPLAQAAQGPPSSKDKPPPVSCGTGEPGGPLLKSPASGPFQSEAGGGPAKPPPSDPGRGPERKEHRSARKGSRPFRENLPEEGGSRRKKGVAQEPARSHSARGHRRADWASGEDPWRRGSPCPRLTPRLKLPVPGGQLRRLATGPGLPKKGEGRPRASGDRKAHRKQSPGGGKALHPLVAKEPSLPSCSKRPRAAQGTKLPDSHNYRTAESQNNLLSQLFGQKLTSFKIPLRRDTSE